MQKFLRTMLLLALFAVPFATQAQVTAERTYLSEDFSVANPEGWTGGSSDYAPTFAPTGAPTWTYTQYVLNGLEAGHYYYNLYAPSRYQWLVSPEMDLTESGEAELRFDIALTAFDGTEAPATVDSGKTVMVLVRVKSNTPGAAWGNWTVLRKWVANPGEGELDITGITNTYMNDTVDFADYLGKYAQIAFYCENTTTRLASVNIHVDNVVCDGKIRAQQPTDLAVASVTTNSVTISWVDEFNPAVDHYELRVVNGEDTVYANTLGGAVRSYTVENLESNTNYKVDIRTWVDANTYSVNWSDPVNAFTHYVTSVELPYSNDFEGLDPLAGWTIVNPAVAGKAGWYLSAADYALVPGQTTYDTVQMANVTVASVSYSIQTYFNGEPYQSYGPFGASAANMQIEQIEQDIVAWAEYGELTYVVDTNAVYDTTDFIAYDAAVAATYANPLFVIDTNISEVDTNWNNVLWVSNDGGVTNAYTISGMPAGAYAYMPVELEAGDYNFSIDWRGNGESTYDYAVAALVNESVAIDTVNTNYNYLPSTWMLISDKMQGSANWKNSYHTFTVASDGIYKVVLFWSNDNGGGTQPPVAIDKLAFSRVICFPVTELAVVDSLATAHTVALTWEDENEVGTYRIIARGPDTLEATVTDPTMPYTFEGLKRESTYAFTVITVCGEDNESNPSETVYGTTTPSCFPVTEIAAEPARAGVTLTWNDDINEGAEYLVMILKGGDTVQQVTVSEMTATITGLEPLTSYTARVYSQCVEDTVYATTNFTTGTVDGNPCGDFQVGTQGTTTSYIPTYSYYNYSLSESLITAEELGGQPRILDKVVYTVTSGSVTRNVAIYIKTTTQTTLTATENVDANTVKVFEGSVAFATGQVTVTFDTPYEFDGESNLLLIVDDNTGSWVSSPSFAAQSGTSMARSVYSDGTNYVPTNATSYSMTARNRPVMGFPIPCFEPDEFVLAVSDRTQSSAVLTWNNPLVALEETPDHYLVVVKSALEGETYDSVEVDTTTYTVEELDHSTTYAVVVKAVYADGLTYTVSDEFDTYGPCNAPTNFVATPNRWSVDLAWNQDDASVDTYQLLVSDSAVSAATLEALTDADFVAVSGNEGYNIADLDTNTTYYIYFRANCGATSKSQFRSATVTTLPLIDCGEPLVADGSATNSYVPVYGNWADAYLRCQTIYPATMLAEQELTAGTTISSLTYYLTSPAAAAWTGTFEVRLMEVSNSAFSSTTYADVAAATLVYTGQLDGTQSTMTITFATPYLYNGGNLLIEVSQTAKGNYKSCTFKGITSSNASIYKYNSSSYTGITSGSNANFIPKTTFGACKLGSLCGETTLEVSDIDYNVATLSWVKPDAKVSGYQLLLSDTAVVDFENVVPEVLGADVTTYNATGLIENATHYAYIRVLCAAANDTSAWTSVSFVTPAYCRVATNLEVVLNGKNSAIATWESTDTNQAANYQYILDTVALTADSLLNYGGDIVSNIADDSIVLSNLAYATNYYMYVRNVCELAGNDAFAPWFGPATFTTIKQMTDVKNLAASVYRNEITATWAADSAHFGNDTAWRVAVAKKGYAAENWQTVTEPTYTWTGLEYDTIYTVYVAAIADTLTSDTVTVNATTAAAMPKVINLATSVYRNEITATWQRDSIHNALDTAWAVAIRKVNDTNDLAWTNVDTMAYTWTGLQYDTLYNVYVKALYQDMMSDSTVKTNVHTGAAMPKVINLATSVYRNEVTATWQRDSINNALDTAWAVAIRKVNDTNDLAWTNVDSMAYTFTGLQYDTLYNVYVKALYQDMVSDSTVKTNVHTGLNMPQVTNITVSNLSHNYAMVSWERGANAIENSWLFGMKKATDTNAFAYTLIDHMDTMIYGLDELTAYQVSIIALNGNDSSLAKTANFTTPSMASALNACFTAANGTNTSGYFPLYGYYADATQRIQSIYPAEMLQEIAGKTINSMHYYVQSGSSANWANGDWYVRLAVTNNTSVANAFDETPTTTVYNGHLSASTTNGMTITLDQPFRYTGGNLLVEFQLPVSIGYTTCTFYGLNNAGSSRMVYPYGSQTSTFLPKVDFCYEGQYIQDLAIDNITETTADASWMPGGHETTWEYVNAEGEMTAAELDTVEKTVVNEQAAALTGLTVDQDYTFYIRAVDTVDIISVVYEFDSIYTWYDTTYSKENPLEMVVITHNDSIMKVALAIDSVSVIDSVIGANDTVYQTADPTLIDSTATVWTPVYDTTWKVVYDTAFNQVMYSDWCKVSYSTPFICAEPTDFRVVGFNADSAAVIATTDADSVNFRYAVKGGEYITVAGVADTVFDTLGVEYVFDTVSADTTWYGYDAEYEYVESTEPFAGYNYFTYAWEDTVTSIDVEYEFDTLETILNIDTIPYFYAYLEPLATNTTYVVAAQSVCGVENMSRWTDEIEFTTLNNCTGTVELPYTENFDGATSYIDCWNVVKDENEYELGDSLDYEIAYYNSQYRLFPAGLVSDHDFIPVEGEARYDRYVISPEFEATEAITKWTSSMMVNTYYVDGNDYSRDSVAFGYSTTNDSIESFTWTEFRSNNGSYNTNWSNVELLPAGVKYVAYRFVGEKPDWMALNSMDIHVADYYAVNAYNGNVGMGTVTMIEDGDTLEMADVYSDTVVEGTAMKLVAEPEHGYRFTGWERINSENHRVVVNNSTTLTFTAADTTLIATFAKNKNTVQVAVNNNSYGTAKITVPADTNKFTAEHGTEFTLVATDTIEGDHISFRGWSTNNNANNIVSYENPYTFNLDAATNNQTQTFTAIFVKDSFEVVVTYNDTMGTIEGEGSHILTANNAVHMAATPNYGYEFLGWLDANGDPLTTDLSFDTASVDSNNLAFTANFQKLPYYIQVTSNDANLGTATATPDSGLYLTPIVLEATPVAEHYHFQFWSDGETENPYNFILTQDTNMIAFFAIDTHKVKVVSDTAMKGYVTINGERVDSAYFDYGTLGVELEAVPNTGVAFTEWSDGYAGNPRIIGAINQDTTFTALFDSIVYTIAVNVNEVEGSVAYDTANGLYLDTLTFVATANPGYRFVAWHDAEENTYFGDTLRYVVTAEETQAITAEYAEAGKVNINLVANIIEGGSVLAMGQSTVAGVPIDTTSIDGYNRFDSLSTVTIVATPAEHYHFLRWEGADDLVSENDTVVIDSIYGEAMTYTAYFEIDTHYIKGIAENGSFQYNGVAADSLYVNYGTTVNVTPVADPYYHFVGWADGTEDTVRSITVLNDTTVEALFGIDTFYVNFVANNDLFGSVAADEGYSSLQGTDTAWYAFGATAVLRATANYGYHFSQWSTEATTDSVEVPVYSSNTITAIFDTNVYNVVANVNDTAMGTVEGPATAKHFTTVNYVAVPNYGYHFVDWTGITSANTDDTAQMSAISDTAFMANFAKNSYTVTAAANYDSLGTVEGTATALYLDTVTLTATAIEGYHVENWSNGMTGDTIQVIADSNKTVTANFAINVYTVTAAANFAERGTVTGAAATEHGATDTLVATANNGYHFDGWSNGVTTDTLVLTVVSDTNVTANFAKNAYAAAAVCDATMGTATVSAAAPLYLDTVIFIATPAEHYRFVNWSNGMTEDTIEVVVVSDTTLTANFEAITYTVNVSSANDTMGTVTPAGDTVVMEGSSFTATAVANPGYHFVSWNTGATTASITVTVDSNMSLVASFEVDAVVIPQYTVILTSANSAMGTVSAGATVDSGDVFTAVATPAADHHFVAWIKGVDTVSTNATYTFTVTEDVSLVAHFAADSTPVTPETYTVTADVNNAAMGTVTGAGSYEAGSECVLVAHANAGYRFVEWRNGDQVLGTDTILTFTVTANITITAVFTQDGIEDVDMSDVTIYSAESKIVVRGAENQSIYVFDVNGRVIATEANAAETCEFRMATTGVYLVKVGNAPAKRVLVVR